MNGEKRGEFYDGCPEKGYSLSEKWTSSLLHIRKPITKTLLAITRCASHYPEICIVSTILFSIGVLIIGLFTNFELVVDGDIMWTPTPSRVQSHGKWVMDRSGFKTPRPFKFSVHAKGENILVKEGIERLFTALDVLGEEPRYDEICRQSAGSSMLDKNHDTTCLMFSPTRFFNNSSEIQDDEIVIQRLSQSTYIDGTPVDTKEILGSTERDEKGLLTSVQMYTTVIFFPGKEVSGSEDVEKSFLDKLLKLRNEWESEPGNIYRLEILAKRSIDDELTRAIYKDIPLVPVSFFLMALFTCITFYRHDWVLSRTLLGFGAVCTVLLSIMTGYGLLFICGIPVTSLTQILPFVMLGIGLDDAFVLTETYTRTDNTKDTLKRIDDTIEEVGVSIFVTTLTSSLVFAFGGISSIPACYWLCQYAAPTIIIDFIFQITFFIALIVIDERRIKERRRDCFVCSTVTDDVVNLPEPVDTIFGRFMNYFSNILMNFRVKVVIIFSFLVMFAGFVYSVSKWTQEFNYLTVLSSDSYIIDYHNYHTLLSDRSRVQPFIYFRDVDQSDDRVQEQMQEYVNRIVDLEPISNPPAFFWLKDFKEFVDDMSLHSLNFTQQINNFLTNSTFKKLYRNQIVFDGDNNILTSRTQVYMDKIDTVDITSQIDALNAQRLVSKTQQINQGRDDWAFFTFTTNFYIWEFNSIVIWEMTLTAIFCVSSISVVGSLFVPHYSAILYIAPLVSVSLIDVVGILQIAGIHINFVSYFALLTSIGLLVDFFIHFLIRYHDSEKDTREGKVKDTLQTIGISILKGGITTFLGVLPLVLSSSEVFFTIFVAFLGLVCVGITHGLILLPVLLSLFGPINIVENDTKKLVSQDKNNESEDEINGTEEEVELQKEVESQEEMNVLKVEINRSHEGGNELQN